MEIYGEGVNATYSIHPSPYDDPRYKLKPSIVLNLVRSDSDVFMIQTEDLDKDVTVIRLSDENMQELFLAYIALRQAREAKESGNQAQ